MMGAQVSMMKTTPTRSEGELKGSMGNSSLPFQPFPKVHHFSSILFYIPPFPPSQPHFLLLFENALTYCAIDL
jgi:hypothetical protein